MRAVLVLVSVVACGGDDPPAASPDAPPGVPDAPMIDAPPAAIACTPRGAPGPITIDALLGAGTTVVVHDPDGARIAEAPVDAGGRAVVTAPSCGMVSVRSTPGVEDGRLLTWTGVQPGDHLVHPEHAAPPVMHAVEVKVAPLAGATDYGVRIACPRRGEARAGDLDPGPHVLQVPCPPGAKAIAVLVEARTPSGLSFALAPDVELAETGMTTVSPPAYVAGSQLVSATLANPGSFVGSTGVILLATVPEGDRPILQSSWIQLVSASAPIGPVANVPGTAATAVVGVLESGSQRRDYTIQKVYAPVPDAIAVDAATDLLARVEATLEDVEARPTATLERTPAGATDADVLVVEIRRNSLRWVLIAPPGTTRVRFPEPLVEATMHSWSAYGVNVIEASDVASYDAARGRLVELMTEATLSTATIRRTTWAVRRRDN